MAQFQELNRMQDKVKESNLVFCCVGTLAILNALDYVNHKKLSRWLMKRQLPNGGLNGRPEKLADVCYCWWVLSALSILGTVEWLSKPKLIDFILSCQDSEGGFSDRPGDYPDVFHTLFAICGLSMLGFDQVSLGQVDPVYCLPTTVIDRHFKRVSEQKAQKDQ